MINIENILEMIPHRYPLLMIDRVEEVIKGETAVAIKNVTFNEPHFTGHFPNKPIMPGVLIIEAMAQTSAVLVVETLGEETKGKLVYFMSVEKAKFRKLVTPGDVLRIKTTILQNRKNVWKFTCEAFVGEDKAADATISAMIVDN